MSITMDADNKKREEELVKEFKAGNKEAFDELIERHAPKLYQASFGLLGNRQDAEEVVQDAFLRAYKGLENFRGDASFETWVCRIAINLSRNKYQWNKRRGAELNLSISEHHQSLEENSSEDMAIPDKAPAPDSILEKAEAEKGIMEAFENLPETLRETMILRHINNMSYEKIAELQECKEGTVKSRIARGREILREYLINVGTNIKIRPLED